MTTLLARGTAVRAVTRRPEDADIPAGIEVVAGDLSDASTLSTRTFDGVDRAFVFPAAGVDAFVGAAVAAGVRRLAVLSSLAAAIEFDRDRGSASQLHHSAVEASIMRRTDEWTILRPGTFANNLLSWAWQIRSGTPIRAPHLDSSQAPIHEYDIAEAAAEALLRDDLLGRTIPLTGPAALTRAEQVAEIGRAVGREVPLVQITPEEFRAETAQFIPEPVLDMLQLLERHGGHARPSQAGDAHHGKAWALARAMGRRPPD